MNQTSRTKQNKNIPYLIFSSIKGKIKENYDETLEVFRRKVQANWNEENTQPELFT